MTRGLNIYRSRPRTNEFFDEFFDRFLAPSSLTEPQFTNLSVDYDVRETKEGYDIHLDLPGLDKEQVKIEVKDHELVISGEKKEEFENESEEKEDHQYTFRGRSYGSFTKRFSLPKDAEADQVAAEFKDGVLKLAIPKTPIAKPRKIEIK